MKKEYEVTHVESKQIKYRIFTIRGMKVMPDKDLANLYQITFKRLNEQVRRNTARFPIDFMFQLTKEDFENLRSQIATSSWNYGGRRYLPYVFTEHGVAMLSSVLRSEKAVQMNIFIVRAFVKIRESLSTYKDLAHKIVELEHTQEKQGEKIDQINNVVIQLIGARTESKDPVGFKPKT